MSRFDDFLITGEIGPLRLGTSPRDLELTLGPPEDVGSVRWPGALWSYGRHFLQVFFEARHVVGFGLYFRHPVGLPDAIGFDEVPFAGNTTTDEVLRYLAERRLPFRLEGDGERLFVANVTEIVFDLDDRRLDKILVFERRGPT